MFHLTEEQELVRNSAREFATTVCAPIAAELDENATWPEASVKQMADLGFMGIPFAEEFGGGGADYLTYVLAVEEISRACAATGVILSAHVSLGTGPINQFGTDEQKRRYLPDLCAGKKLGAFCLTEAGAGTDAASRRPWPRYKVTITSSMARRCLSPTVTRPTSTSSLR